MSKRDLWNEYKQTDKQTNKEIFLVYGICSTSSSKYDNLMFYNFDIHPCVTFRIALAMS